VNDGADGLRERVRAVVPLIASRATDAEQRRQPADDVIEALKRTGVFRSFVPKRYGGYEIDLELFLDIGADVSEACPSTGWITTFYMEHNWLLGMFDEQLQDEIFTVQPYILAPGTVNPSGEATRRDDHYELSGRWQFGTGIVHADWTLLSGRIVDEEHPLPRMFLVPVDDVEVKDTWHVDGMAATGSRDIVARSVQVPFRRVSSVPLGVSDPAAGYLRRIPVLPFLALTAGIPAIGCARRSVQLFRARMRDRVMFGSTKRQGETSAGQTRLGNVTVRAAMAESTMRTVARELAAHARGDTDLTTIDQARLRLTVAHVVRQCRDIVRDVLEASGAGAHFLDNELQRIHRDVHMIAAHTVFDVEVAALDLGRALLKADASS
jgi:alkylation response protein AidB-like acyl-CoA dehydrogenase